MIKVPKNKKFNLKQLTIGQKIEMEHTRNPFIALMIAKQHLTEFPNYYTYLIKMERKLKRLNKK